MKWDLYTRLWWILGDKKARKVLKMLEKHYEVTEKVACESCGQSAFECSDYCYGCERVICIDCSEAYDHFMDGKHGLKINEPKPATQLELQYEPQNVG